MHIFDKAERRRHVERLADALDVASVALMQFRPLEPDGKAFRQFADRCRDLLRGDLSQDSLTKLVNELPDPLGSRRTPRFEWPMKLDKNGSYAEYKWVSTVKPVLEEVNTAASALRTVGYY
jgi:hypothetical protein